LYFSIAVTASTVFPQNTAVVAGASTTLYCTQGGNSNAVSWFFQGQTTIVAGCVVMSNFQTQYNVTSDTAGQCDLLIINAQADISGSYLCTGSAAAASAYLTVIGNISVSYTFS
jgi:hypothetical protein